eukprot:113915-Prorocentrum_minimum.AAC.1
MRPWVGAPRREGAGAIFWDTFGTLLGMREREKKGVRAPVFVHGVEEHLLPPSQILAQRKVVRLAHVQLG